MLNSAKRSWTLALLANPGSTLPPELQALNGGTLDVFGQHQVKRSDPFGMFASQVRWVYGSQLTGGAIDEHNHVGFIFVSNGEPDGTQYVFHSATLQMGGGPILPKLTGGTITRHIGGDVDDDVGTWSGTGGGSADD
jgi:hypothetical protein